ncbi:MAG: Ig-like domain repeat protein [Acidobacteria bacterium]|nr:Ig-like domain repeat protein [Acidobacteriota bacterium]
MNLVSLVSIAPTRACRSLCPAHATLDGVRSLLLVAMSVAILLLTGTRALRAQSTIHVPADQPTIQAAIDAAQNGDTVLVAPGTYYENLLVQNKSITVRSDKGAALTILDGGKKNVVASIYASVGFNITLDGFTIQNGATSLSPSNGGIVAYGFATIQNNIIRSNWGYGITVQGGSVNILNNHVITTAPSASQGYCYVYALNGINLVSNMLAGQITQVQTRISGNLIEGDGTFCSGPGIGVTATSPVLIENNIVRGTTRGIGVSDGQRADDDVHVIVRQNLIYNNRYGGLYFDYFPFFGSTPYGVAPVTMVATNNTLYNNVTSGTYYDNTGGGPLAEVVLGDFYSRMALFNNLIIGNSSVSPVINCSSTGGVSSVNRTPPIFDHNDIYNAQPSSAALFLNDCGYAASFIGLNGNISANPLFASSTDLHLSRSSPSVDAANNSAFGIADTDPDGNPRVQDAKGIGYPVIDMGAYEASGSQAPAISTLTLTPSTYYQLRPEPITLTAILRSPSGPVSAPITFLQDDVPLPPVNADATGTATISLPKLPAGIYRFTASYAGSTSLSPATSTVVYVRVPAPQSTLVLTPSPNPAAYKQSVTFTATVTSTASPTSPPSGIVAFTESASILSNQALVPGTGNTAVATYSTSTLTPGVHNITATFSPTPRFDGDSQTVQVSITGNSTCGTLVSSANPGTLGQSITFTSSVVNTCGGLAPPTGLVYLSDGTKLIGAVSLTAISGTASAASFSTSSLTFGTHTLTAAFRLDQGPQTITAALLQVVNLPTSTGITASPNPAAPGSSVAITATVKSPSSIPTGTVTILDGAAPIASLPLDAQGNATLNTSALAIGVHSLSATYSGDATHTGSTSAPLLETIQLPPDFTLALSNPQLTIQTQHHATTSVTLSSLNGFADSVSLACGTLPQYVSCSFTPSTSALASGGSASVVLSVDTDSVPGYAMRLDPTRRSVATLAVLLCPVGLLSFVGLRSRVRSRVRLCGLFLAFACIAGILNGCGGKGASGSVPPVRIPPSATPGTYTIPVTATGTTAGITRTVQLTLTVTP